MKALKRGSVCIAFREVFDLAVRDLGWTLCTRDEVMTSSGVMATTLNLLGIKENNNNYLDGWEIKTSKTVRHLHFYAWTIMTKTMNG